MNPPPDGIVAVLLAGGLARRMGGGDKCLVPLAGRPMLAHVIERIAPQVERVLINANGDPARFSGFGLPVAADTVEGFAGPLAGVLAGLEWTVRNVPEATHMVSIATDTPFFPTDLVTRLVAGVQAGGMPLAVASSAGRTHPVFGLWPVSLLDNLTEAVTVEGLRKVDIWTARHGVAQVEFDTRAGDPFFNLNRPEDIAEAEIRLQGERM
ncbi:MAG: molybdenum cofactor guanylyltransferase MobA [Hyphomicrobiales bacterium]